MLPLIALFIGAAIGWIRAARRGGETPDKAQYAVAHGLAFGLAAFAIGILITRSGLF